MAYRHFRVGVLVRIVALCGTLVLFLYLLQQTEFYATAAVAGIVAFALIVNLILYVEKTNRDLSRFLAAVRYGDFSQTFSASGRGTAFDDLRQSFADVMNELRKTRTQSEEQYQYLQTVVQHIGIGLVAFTQNGDVGLVNAAAKRLFQVNHLNTIHSLESVSPSLVDNLLRLKSGEKKLLRVELGNEPVQLSIYATEFRLREQHYTLVSIQNIRSELEEKEMEAWQKLIRVLTHEIMNSITPISSLASTAHEMLQRDDTSSAVSADTLDDVRDAVQTIEKRSEGLLHFVDAYRNLTRIPRPNFKIFRVATMFAQAELLLRVQVQNKSILFSASVEPESLELTADPELIEQVLINLLLNAIHAVQEQPEPQVRLQARLDARGKVVVEVWDNGPGITEEAQDKIFIPFYTTKENGSGIGLSLSKEIMRLHRGNIRVHAKPGSGTSFLLSF
ncbi:MAG TPA: ATP-binding protein [Bacteroidota bacterium]